MFTAISPTLSLIQSLKNIYWVPRLVSVKLLKLHYRGIVFTFHSSFLENHILGFATAKLPTMARQPLTTDVCHNWLFWLLSLSPPLWAAPAWSPLLTPLWFSYSSHSTIGFWGCSPHPHLMPSVACHTEECVSASLAVTSHVSLFQTFLATYLLIISTWESPTALHSICLNEKSNSHSNLPLLSPHLTERCHHPPSCLRPSLFLVPTFSIPPSLSNLSSSLCSHYLILVQVMAFLAQTLEITS